MKNCSAKFSKLSENQWKCTRFLIVQKIKVLKLPDCACFWPPSRFKSGALGPVIITTGIEAEGIQMGHENIYDHYVELRKQNYTKCLGSKFYSYFESGENEEKNKIYLNLKNNIQYISAQTAFSNNESILVMICDILFFKRSFISSS